MSFSERFFNFKGRLPRSQYWLYHLAQAIVLLVAVFLISGIAKAFGDTPTTRVALGLAILPLYAVFVWSSLSVSARRCHDREKSAWFLLLSFIPLVNLWVLVELGFLEGTKGPNRYGPSPKGIGGNAVAGVFS
jgi:uncharacterized membrane protein YhaH (DUF805 family)